MRDRALINVIFATAASAAPAHLPSAKLEPGNEVAAPAVPSFSSSGLAQQAAPHGLAFSGGSLPGLMSAMSVLHAMEKYVLSAPPRQRIAHTCPFALLHSVSACACASRPSARTQHALCLGVARRYGVTPNADTTDDSTNSGGSLGHAVYVSNQENIEFPDLESKSQWDYTELATWKATTKPFSFNECQNLAKYIPATKVTESSKVAKLAADTGDTNEDTNGISTTEFVNIKGVAKCLGDSLVVGGHQSLW